MVRAPYAEGASSNAASWVVTSSAGNSFSWTQASSSGRTARGCEIPRCSVMSFAYMCISGTPVLVAR